MKLRFSHKILLATLTVIMLAFALSAIYNDSFQRKNIEKRLQNSLNETGRSTAENISNWLSGRVLLIENLSEGIDLDNHESLLKTRLAQDSLARTFRHAYAGGSDGRFWVQPADVMPSGFDPRTRPWYTGAMKAGGTTLSTPYPDSITHALTIAIATPIKKNGALTGVAGGNLALDSMAKTISSVTLPGKGFAFLIDNEGQILIHPDQKIIMKHLSDAYTTPPTITSDLISEVEYNGRKQIISFSHVNGLPSVNWYIGLAVDKEEAYRSLTELRGTAVITTLISVLLITALLSLLFKLLMRPLQNARQAMEDIADGDGGLTQRLTISTQDEFGSLGQSFNRFVQRIHESMLEVSCSTIHLNNVAKKVLGVSNDSTQNSDHQVQRITSVAAAIEELGAAAQEIASNAALASESSSQASSIASSGQSAVQDTIQAMGQLGENISAARDQIEILNEKTGSISRILEVISGISQQTNLLALNAAIEAARAGEAGRGFAVVADEVRNLAHRTQASAEQVQVMIEELQLVARDAVTIMQNSQQQSEKTITAVNTAGAHLRAVTQRMTDTEVMNQSIAAATEEQTAVIESINSDISQISSLNQDGLSNLKTTLKACSELEQEASRLDYLVSSFKVHNR
ncbi:methyl-accepting chemotaxis protein [Pseudomonas veronii]|uniref:methyl-accepting chemotaxis protein n=1 Tax=Pseudomonas veronii TaxID=76761 RepID=UPI002D783E5C|nr:methyl-accepting chemotaxis protein [Pseudomonas veronii]WRU61163.1 methyl-accepting chemotaxis protein [Pseudomonas veronii]